MLIIGAVSAVLILVIGLAVILGTGMVGGGGDAGSGPVEPRTLLGRMQQAIRSEDLGRIERVEAEYKRLIDGVTSGRIPKPPDFQRIQAMSRGLRDAKSKLTAP